jgi:hypothetical protein
MTDTTVDKTDPAKTPPKPGDKAVTTPAKPADENAAGAAAALHSDSTHPALAAKTTDAKPAAPAKTEAETLADKLYADLGWAYHTAASTTKALVADVTGTTPAKDGTTPAKDGTTPAKDGTPAPAAAGKDAAPGAAAAPKDGTAPKPAPPGTAPAEAQAPAAKEAPAPPAAPAKPASTSIWGDVSGFIGNSVTAAGNEASALYTDATVAGSAVVASAKADVVAAKADVSAVVSDVTGVGASATNTAAADVGSISTDAGSLYNSLTSAATGALTTFTNYFGTGSDALQSFASTAEKVKDVATLDLNPSKLFSDANSAAGIMSTDMSAAVKAAEAAGISWAIPGKDTPGGTPSVSAQGGHELGSGKNVDGVPVSVDVTQKSSQATAGDMKAVVNKQIGSRVSTPDFTTTKKGDITITVDNKTHITTTFDAKTQMLTVENPANGTKETYSAKDITTQVDPHTEVHQVGDAGSAAAAAAATPGQPGASDIQSRFFQDSKGNAALVQSDGTIYKYDKKSNTLQVGKDNHWVEENLTTKKLSYYTEDPKTHVRTEVPAGSLPKGVTVGADGGISVKGAKVADANGLIHMGDTGSTYNTASTTLTTDGGKVTVKSKTDGSGTELNGPGQLKVDAPADPSKAPAVISQGGETMTHDPVTNTWKMTKPDGANVIIGADGSVRNESADHLVGTIDAHGNVNATDAKNKPLFNISDTGCVGMYDGTQFNPDGEISNQSTGFREMAYIPTSVDASDDNYDPGNSSGSNGYSSDNSYSDGSGSDGSDPYASQNGSGTTDGTVAPNNPNGIETAYLQQGDVDSMNTATYDAFENKYDSSLDRIKARWNFGQDVAENKDDALTGREDTTEFSKWVKDVQKGDLVDLPREWKIQGLVQNLDLNTFAKGDKDSMTGGTANIGDVASIESFKDNLDALSVKLGIDTSGFEAQLNGMEKKIESKLAATQRLEESGLAPTAANIKRAQDNGNTVIANQFTSDERATA